MPLSHLTRIAFGRNCPDGSSVSDAAWQAFEAETIARAFPDGFTVLAAHGAWRDAASGETIQEPSVIVEVAHDGAPETLAAIRAVAAVYKTLFRQDAVMLTTTAAEVEFV